MKLGSKSKIERERRERRRKGVTGRVKKGQGGREIERRGKGTE